jgi:hypothetical protein
MPDRKENTTPAIPLATLEFTTEEKEQLAEAITKAACGIARCWDILSEIGARIGRDWEPENRNSVADIAEHYAAVIDNPDATERLDSASVAESFSDPDDWAEVVQS